MTNETELTFSPEVEAKLQEIIARYPQPCSAVLPALYLAQEELGWIDERAVLWVAGRTGVSAAEVQSTATFYSMFYKKPVGKYHLQICRTLSCALCGSKILAQHLMQCLKIVPGEVSSDGMWSLEEVECLGSCATAPVIQINDVYFERLTTDKLDHILERIKQEQPDLKYSTLREELGGGLADYPRSQVWSLENQE